MARNWMITGKAPNTGFVGSGSGKTGLKSEIMVTSKREGGVRREAKTITTADTGTMVEFEEVHNSDWIRYWIQTTCDSKGVQDKANIDLYLLNMPFLTREITDYLASLPEAEQAAMIEDTSLLEAALGPILEQNADKCIALVRSERVNTNASGYGEGEIRIEPNWPEGPIIAIAHYGYSGQSEQSDSAKWWDFFVNELLPIIVELVIIIVACTIGAIVSAGGICAATLGWYALTLSLAVAAAQIAYHIAKDGYGAIDSNADGCLFPTPGGFNQTYTLNLITDPKQYAANVNPALAQNPATVAAIETQSQTSISTGEMKANWGLIALLFGTGLLSVFLMFGGDDVGESS